MVIREFEVYLVNLDPTIGHEIKKTRPCVILTPERMNSVLGTVIIAPLTSSIKGYPSRTKVTFQGKTGEVCIDQMRAVDETRLTKKLGKLEAEFVDELKDVIFETLDLG